MNRQSAELMIERPPALVTAPTIDQREAEITAAAAEVLAPGRRAVLGYSGGLESNLLLDLLHPWRAQITVAWVSARPLPHMADYVRRRTAGWQFLEIHSDPARFFTQSGLPARVVPVAHTIEGHGDAAGPVPFPPVRTETECCNAVRVAPLFGFMAVSGADVLIHGQRGGEGTTAFAANPHPWDRWGPLFDWSRQDVETAVRRRGIELPAQYAHGLNSFECAICPAETDPRRLVYLRTQYPDLHTEALTLMRAVHAAADRALGEYRAALDTDATAPAKTPADSPAR